MAAAAVITDAIFEKMVLMLVDTPGRMAPAATATKPAIRAYSIISWARVSFQILSFHNSRFKRFILTIMLDEAPQVKHNGQFNE